MRENYCFPARYGFSAFLLLIFTLGSAYAGPPPSPPPTFHLYWTNDQNATLVAKIKTTDCIEGSSSTKNLVLGPAGSATAKQKTSFQFQFTGECQLQSSYIYLKLFNKKTGQYVGALGIGSETIVPVCHHKTRYVWSKIIVGVHVFPDYFHACAFSHNKVYIDRMNAVMDMKNFTSTLYVKLHVNK